MGSLLIALIFTLQGEKFEYKHFTGDVHGLTFTIIYEQAFDPANIGGLVDLQKISDSLYTAKVKMQVML